MKTAAILLPASFPDAIGQGEYHRDELGVVRVGCPACQVVQRVEDVDVLWSCENPACPAMLWLELALAR